MYIRRTLTRSLDSGEHYYSHRLVRSERVAGRVRQVTLLNLGQHFAPVQDQWPGLCGRIEEILAGQTVAVTPGWDLGLEREAQRLAALLLVRQARPVVPTMERAAGPTEVTFLELARARSVGVEQVALWAIAELQLAQRLRALGMPQRQVTAVLGMIVGRLAAAGKERSTFAWWGERSALGELLGVDLAAFSPLVLYRAGDSLLKHRQDLEGQVFERLQDLCGLTARPAIYDLSLHCLAGVLGTGARFRPEEPPGAMRGDRALVTLGLVLDTSGFIRRSASFVGHAAAVPTLKTMLDGLGAPAGALVAIDRKLASGANLAWLRANGYSFLVVSDEREPAPRPDCAAAGSLTLYQVVSADGDEVHLYYHAPDREAREAALGARWTARLEAGLRRLAAGLAKPGGERCLEWVNERIARLKERCGPVGDHYRTTPTADASGKYAVALTWERQVAPGSRGAACGFYCLRSSATDWDAGQLFDAYRALTERDAVFGSFTDTPGLRAAEHHGEECAAAQLVIAVLAYQCVQVVRRHLMAKGIDASWPALRQTLAGHCRVTASFRRGDGSTLHVRTATGADPEQLAIYQALGIDPVPGGMQQTHI